MDLKFYGMQKLSLLDFPGKMCATVFTGGCKLPLPVLPQFIAC